MIVSIKLHNFLSFKDETVTLYPNTNVVAGINGSGKTNLMKALQLLHAVVSERNGVQSLIAKWGGIDEIINKSSKSEEINLEFELDQRILLDYTNNVIFKINISKNNSRNTFNTRYFIGFELENGYDFKELKDGKFLSTKEDEAHFTDVVTKLMRGQTISDDEPRVSYDAFMEFIANSNNFFEPIEKALQDISLYTHFDTSEKSPLRRPITDTSFNTKLVADGGNLPQILNQINIEDIAAFDKILEEVQNVNPNFKDIRFNYLATTIVMTFREKGMNSAVNCNALSDGTLRFLCLLAVLCNPVKSSLICLDEPELGLHPDMIAVLARLIQEKSRTTQILIITHSPLLMNHFELDNVLFFEKDDDNNSIQKHFAAADFDENEMAGSLWVKGYLGGRRW